MNLAHQVEHLVFMKLHIRKLHLDRALQFLYLVVLQVLQQVVVAAAVV